MKHFTVPRTLYRFCGLVSGESGTDKSFCLDTTQEPLQWSLLPLFSTQITTLSAATWISEQDILITGGGNYLGIKDVHVFNIHTQHLRKMPSMLTNHGRHCTVQMNGCVY